MMFSPILVGFQWKYIFNDNIGLLNNFLREFGVSPKPWLVDAFLANMSIMAAEIWSSTSVFAILLLAGLMGIPKDPIEAAKVDGCKVMGFKLGTNRQPVASGGEIKNKLEVFEADPIFIKYIKIVKAPKETNKI